MDVLIDFIGARVGIRQALTKFAARIALWVLGSERWVLARWLRIADRTCIDSSHFIGIIIARTFLFYGVLAMKRTLIFLTLIAALVSACGAAPATQRPVKFIPLPATEMPTSTSLPPTPTPTDSPTPVLTATLTPAPVAPKTVTFAEEVTCRMGPDKHYYAVVTSLPAETATLAGRSADSAWVMVDVTAPNKASVCWVPVASLENPGDLSAVDVIPAIGLPAGPLSLTATNGVCGTTALPMKLDWVRAAPGLGYRIYRNGKNIGTVYDDHFRDFDTPRSKKPYIYIYTVESFSAIGVSEKSVSTSVTLCQ